MKKLFTFVFLFVIAGAGAFLLLPETEVVLDKKTRIENVPLLKLAVVSEKKPLILSRIPDVWMPYFTLLYEPLISVRDDEVEPVLASTVNDGVSEYIFDIRPGITFSNGKELTPADVVWSYDLAKANNALPNSVLENVTETKVDGTKVRFKVKKVMPEFKRDITRLFIFDEETFVKESKIVGTGSYSEETNALLANDTYWGTAPLVERIELTATTELSDVFDAYLAAKSGLSETDKLKLSGYTELGELQTDIGLFVKGGLVVEGSNFGVGDIGRRVEFEEKRVVKTPRWKSYALQYGIIKED